MTGRAADRMCLAIKVVARWRGSQRLDACSQSSLILPCPSVFVLTCSALTCWLLARGLNLPPVEIKVVWWVRESVHSFSLCDCGYVNVSVGVPDISIKRVLLTPRVQSACWTRSGGSSSHLGRSLGTRCRVEKANLINEQETHTLVLSSCSESGLRVWLVFLN